MHSTCTTKREHELDGEELVIFYRFSGTTSDFNEIGPKLMHAVKTAFAFAQGKDLDPADSKRLSDASGVAASAVREALFPDPKIYPEAAPAVVKSGYTWAKVRMVSYVPVRAFILIHASDIAPDAVLRHKPSSSRQPPLARGSRTLSPIS